MTLLAWNMRTCATLKACIAQGVQQGVHAHAHMCNAHGMQHAHMRNAQGIQRSRRATRHACTHMGTRRAFGEVLECVNKAGRVAAVTSPDKAQAVNEQQPGFWELKKVL